MSRACGVKAKIHGSVWVRSWRCGCLVTRFCYLLIAKPGNKTATPPWPNLYELTLKDTQPLLTKYTPCSICHWFSNTIHVCPVSIHSELGVVARLYHSMVCSALFLQRAFNQCIVQYNTPWRAIICDHPCHLIDIVNCYCSYTWQ